ncbi:T9SS type A sorting domain-containing protein [Hymenobacter cellulosivorans]|uniref:T9SS type A sorting domain-containing protein n=1 Tax=Hymenobacter cellulosivorans TaxID=2932249 RepID=A0ABY4F7X8_9BACT|nr:T9SS type A sorting domain-containing protein [Hymenobacter cellulosivorans]UOQ52019.1 T9SS type A sorting domain-containing protein [Hymenobacter cellulosivorans]
MQHPLPSLPRPLALALLTLSFSPLAAQTLTNHGSRISVQPGTFLAVADSLLNLPVGQVYNAGTLQVGRTLRNTGTMTSPGLLRFSGSDQQRLAHNGFGIAKLEADNTGNAPQSLLLVANSLTVDQELRLTTGLIRTTATSTISLPAGAVLVGETAGRTVQGNLRISRTASGSTDFGHGFTLDPQGQNLGLISVTRTSGLHQDGSSYATLGSTGPGIDRIWRITSANAPVAPVAVEVTWPAADDNGFTNRSAAQVWQQAGSSTAWAPTGPRADASSRRISFTTTSLGRFTVGNTQAPLPVELVSFSAERRNTDGLLRWATASEKNSAYFVVESSTDARLFHALGRVAGQGSTTRRSDYQFVDANLARYAASIVYYRLRQVDADGAETLSPVRTLQVPAPTKLVAEAFPVPLPAGQQLQLRVLTGQAGAADLVVVDALGRALLQRRLSLPAGSTTLTLPEAAQWPQGVYQLRLIQVQQHTTLKVVRN